MAELMTDLPLCLSGGALGADLQFGMNAGKAGHQVIHFSFGSHKTEAPDIEVVRLTEAQLVQADEHLVRANQTLRRRFPTSNPFTNCLLRRNWYQVKDAESVYAVASFKNGLVTGGTAWAMQMFLDRASGGGAYVFDQEADHWWSWESDEWRPSAPPGVPKGIYAGIGSRDLKENGKNAIRVLFST